MRILITIAPLSYRQVLMLTLRRLRPQVEVILARPKDLDEEVERLAPELVVCNTATQRVRDGTASWVEILFQNGLGANVCVGEATSTLEEVGTEDLLRIVDETERLAS
ncbi:MAG: hypothetical protein WA990_05425 [Rubrobacteraceae bacterium]